MCAKTPATCPTCGENLYWLADQRTECLNRHTGRTSDVPVSPGHDLVSQYHANGRSHVMIRTLCAHCRPL
jgi:phosphopantetheine adenylyltransferase